MKDYAKKQPTKKKQGRFLTLWLALTLIIASIFFLQHHQKKEKTVSTPKKVTQQTKKQLPPPSKNLVSAKQSDITPPMKFDFYHLLAETSVNVSDQQQSDEKNPKHLFALQVAAVKTLEDAKKLKTQLNLTGYATFTEPYQAPNHTKWFRVLVGPFKTTKDAKAQQNLLYKNNIESILLKK